MIEAEKGIGRRILVKNKDLDRERRKRYQDNWIWNDSGWTSDIYRKPSSIDLEGIENKISIDWEVSRRYRRQKDLDRLRRYRASIKQIETLKNWLDGSSYLSRGIKNKPRNLNRRGIYWGFIELLSRRYRASIEKPKPRFFKEEKPHMMNAIKIDTLTSNQEAC